MRQVVLSIQYPYFRVEKTETQVGYGNLPTVTQLVSGREESEVSSLALEFMSLITLISLSNHCFSLIV